MILTDDPEQALRDEVEGLRHAMESRAVIEQAKGILMFIYQIPEGPAFAILTRWSMHHQIKVRDLAVALIEISVGGDTPVSDAGGAHLAVRDGLRFHTIHPVLCEA